MTEIFDGLAVIDDPITEEDRVVHLLASLLESYDILVTALEANVEVPKMELSQGGRGESKIGKKGVMYFVNDPI